MNALERNGSPKPEFETDDARSYFISRFFIHEGFASDSSQEPKRRQKGAERKHKILEILADNPLTTQSQLMEELNITRKQIQNEIKKLQEEGLLEREGSNRKGYWVVKG